MQWQEQMLGRHRVNGGTGYAVLPKAEGNLGAATELQVNYEKYRESRLDRGREHGGAWEGRRHC